MYAYWVTHVRRSSCFLSRRCFAVRRINSGSANINTSDRSCLLIAKHNLDDQLSRLQHQSPAIIITRTFAKKKRRKASTTQDFNSINDLLQISCHNLSPAEIAAVWTCIPRLLIKSKGHRSSESQRMLRLKQINDVQFQISDIVDCTINSLGLMTPKELANVVYALGRIMSKLDMTTSNKPKHVFYQAIWNVLLDEKFNFNKKILHPFEIACKETMPHFNLNSLSNVSDAFAMMKYDPVFNEGRTMFDCIASETMNHLDALDPKSVSIILRSYASLNISTPLFHSLGDAIVNRMCLDEFSPKYISDLAWAYATIHKQHQTLFEGIANSIAKKKYMKSCQPSDFSNILWSYASLNIPHSSLFQKIGDAIISSKDLSLKSFQPDNLAQIVCSFAKMNERHPSLFAKVADAILQVGHMSTLRADELSNILWAYAILYEKDDCLSLTTAFHKRLFKKVGDSLTFADLEASSSNTLSNAVWAFATTNISHPALFQRVGNIIASRKDLTSFSPENLSNIVWAYATLNKPHLSCLLAINNHVCNLDNLEMFSTNALMKLVGSHVLDDNNTELFLKLGDALAARDGLALFDSQCLMDTLAAFAVVKLHHASLFKAIGDALLSKDDLKSLTPSVFMLAVLPHATMNKYHPGLDIGESFFQFLEVNGFNRESFQDITEGIDANKSKSHASLLENLGDMLIQWNQLSLLESHNLAILLAAFSAANVHDASLMNDIGDIIASRSDLITLTPQVLSETVDAFVNIHNLHPNLFQKVGDILTSHDDLLNTSHEVLSRIVLSYSNLPHHELLQRIGDILVERDDLHTVSLERLSDIICSFSTADVSHTVLLNKIGDTIALRDDNISDLNPPDILWAYVKADVSHPNLFCKLPEKVCLLQAAKGLRFYEDTGRSLEVIINLTWSCAFKAQDEEFSQHTNLQLFRRIGDAITAHKVSLLSAEDMVKAAWTFATMSVRHSALFKMIGDALVHQNATRDFSRKQISELIWAFNALSESHCSLFEKIADQIAELGGLHTFEPGDMAHISRAFAVADIDSELIFDENFIEELCKQSQMKTIDYHALRPLYQWHLWRVGEKKKPGLPQQLRMNCRKAFFKSNQNTQSSNFQDDVIEQLNSLGLKPVQGYFTRTGYSLDALVKINGKKVGIEVDGPCHFVGRRPNSSTKLKRRLIKANDRFKVVSVPYWEWNRQGKNQIKKKKYLRSLLGLKQEQ